MSGYAEQIEHGALSVDDEFYVKRGNKYIRVSDPYAASGLMVGHWHVWVRPGQGVTMRKMCYPDRRTVSAAIEEARATMERAISKALALKPRKRENTPKEIEAWEAYCKVLGQDPDVGVVWLQQESVFAAVDAAIQALKERWWDREDYARNLDDIPLKSSPAGV